MAERESFATCVPLYTRSMLSAAAALVGVADAEDATQEAIMRAWQAWPTLRDVGAARAWLLRITINVCRQWQRGGFGKEHRLTQPLPNDSDIGSNPSPSNKLIDALGFFGGDPGTSDFTGVLDLREAINRLDVNMRVVIMLRYYAEMDATEIGQALGMPPATVRTRLRRALEALRTQMGVATRASAADSTANMTAAIGSAATAATSATSATNALTTAATDAPQPAARSDHHV